MWRLRKRCTKQLCLMRKCGLWHHEQCKEIHGDDFGKLHKLSVQCFCRKCCYNNSDDYDYLAACRHIEQVCVIIVFMYSFFAANTC